MGWLPTDMFTYVENVFNLKGQWEYEKGHGSLVAAANICKDTLVIKFAYNEYNSRNSQMQKS